MNGNLYTTDNDLYEIAENIGDTVSFEVHDSLLVGLRELNLINGQEHMLLGRGSCLKMISDEMGAAVFECLGEVLRRIDKARAAGWQMQAGGDANAPADAASAVNVMVSRIAVTG